MDLPKPPKQAITTILKRIEQKGVNPDYIVNVAMYVVRNEAERLTKKQHEGTPLNEVEVNTLLNIIKAISTFKNAKARTKENDLLIENMSYSQMSEEELLEAKSKLEPEEE